MSLSYKQAVALFVTLHSIEGATDRWVLVKKPSDGELQSILMREFGKEGGCSFCDWETEFAGWSNRGPVLTIAIEGEPPLTLQGKPLLDAVQKTLRLG